MEEKWSAGVAKDVVRHVGCSTKLAAAAPWERMEIKESTKPIGRVCGDFLRGEIMGNVFEVEAKRVEGKRLSVPQSLILLSFWQQTEWSCLSLLVCKPSTLH